MNKTNKKTYMYMYDLSQPRLVVENLFLALSLSDVVFIMPINVKMPTIVLLAF